MPTIQARLELNAPGDEYEQEADRVAAQVTQHMQSPPSAPPPHRGSAPAPIQRALRPSLDLAPQAQSALEQRDDQGEAAEDVASAIDQARGGGQPLDAGLQQRLGRVMGANFGGVRIHTDAQSEQLNRSIQARAFTTGQDIFFRQGTYQPGSRAGQELIAHELTHVVQQQPGRVALNRQSAGPERSGGAHADDPQVSIAGAAGAGAEVVMRAGDKEEEKEKEIELAAPAALSSTQTEALVGADKLIGHSDPESLDGLVLPPPRPKELAVADLALPPPRPRELALPPPRPKELAVAVSGEEISVPSIDLPEKTEKHKERYRQAKDAEATGADTKFEQLKHLQKLEVLLAENARTGKGESQLADLSWISDEIGKLGKQQRIQYQEKLTKTLGISPQKPVKPFQSIGMEGTIAASSGQGMKTPFTPEELAAIRIYTSSYHSIMNPLLSGNEAWIKKQAPGIYLGARKDRRKAEVEALQHARIATAGLQELLNYPNDVYRGEHISLTQFKRRYEENRTNPGSTFSSFSSDRTVAERFANGCESGEVPVFVTLVSGHTGKDIHAYSLFNDPHDGEKEVLVPPGAEFKVIQGVKKEGPEPAPDGGFYKAKIQQTSFGSLGGVPSKAAAQAGQPGSSTSTAPAQPDLSALMDDPMATALDAVKKKKP